MKALVTGGAGFIGSHLVEALLAQGRQVIVLDDLSTGRLSNVSHLTRDPGFSFTEGSILDASLVESLAAQCREIYHLGAAVGVRLIVEHPVRTIETNVRGTYAVLDAAVRHDCRVLVSSTSEVYGKDVPGPDGKFRETDDLTLGTSMRWCYASSKAVDEYLARAYYREKGLPIVIARFFNTVGPRQTGAYGMVVPRLVEQALRNRPLTVHGDGEQIRTFTWVGDAVRAVTGLMETPTATGEIFNIGSDAPVTINALARRVLALTGSASMVVHVSYEEAFGPDFEDIRSRVPDITRLRETIGYHPTMDLDDILRQVIAQMRGEMAMTGPAPAE